MGTHQKLTNVDQDSKSYNYVQVQRAALANTQISDRDKITLSGKIRLLLMRYSLHRF
jgi:hypothetical protein